MNSGLGSENPDLEYSCMYVSGQLYSKRCVDRRKYGFVFAAIVVLSIALPTSETGIADQLHRTLDIVGGFDPWEKMRQRSEGVANLKLQGELRTRECVEQQSYDYSRRPCKTLWSIFSYKMASWRYSELSGAVCEERMERVLERASRALSSMWLAQI